jgi:hypothetical protein
MPTLSVTKTEADTQSKLLALRIWDKEHPEQRRARRKRRQDKEWLERFNALMDEEFDKEFRTYSSTMTIEKYVKVLLKNIYDFLKEHKLFSDSVLDQPYNIKKFLYILFTSPYRSLIFIHCTARYFKHLMKFLYNRNLLDYNTKEYLDKMFVVYPQMNERTKDKETINKSLICKELINELKQGE